MRYMLFTALIIAIGMHHYEFDLANWVTAKNDTVIINDLELEKKVVTIGELRKQCLNEFNNAMNCFDIGKVKQHQISSNDCPCHGRFMK